MASPKTAKRKAAKTKSAKTEKIGRAGSASRDVVCRAFAVAYLRYGNQLRAYREAHPTSQANDNTAGKEAWKLLHDERTQEHIRRLQDAACSRASASLSEWIANELRIVRFDPARLLDEQGNVLPLADMDPDTRFAIESVEVDEEKIEVRKAGEDTEIITRSRVRKIKTHSKHQAQDRLGKHLGAYLRDNEQKSATYEEVLKALHGQPDNG